MREYAVAITPLSFSPIALEFAVPKGKNADIVDGINRLMEEMADDSDSAYSRIYDKWTQPPKSVFIPTWLWWGFGALMVFGLFLAFWNFLLKRQVAVKTKHLITEIAEHRQTEKKVRQSLREKETLIRELYHRTKNTMQVIRSLV